MVSAYDPDDFDFADGHPPRTRVGWLADYDDIVEGDTITVDLELLDNLAAAVDAYDNDDNIPRVGTALAVFAAARALIADTAGGQP